MAETGVRVARTAGHVALERVRPPRLLTAEDVPRDPDRISPRWLTDCLCHDHPGAAVTAVESFGGTSGTSTRRRLRLTYNTEGRRAGLPEALYVKTTSSLPQRLMLGLVGILAVEGQVYERVLPLLDIEAPRGYACGYDPPSWRSFVLTEDVMETRGARFVEPGEELTLAQVKELLTAMATWHGAMWEHPVLDGDWLQNTAERQAALSRFLDWGARSAVGWERVGDGVPDSVRANHAAVVDAFGRAMVLASDGPATFLHGDPHSGGNFYVTAGGTLGWADWGVCLKGSWGYDVAYFLAASLPVENRRRWEEELLSHYLQHLAAAGGAAPTFEDAWLTYRQQALYPAVAWAAVFGHGRLQPDSQPPEFCIPIIERATHAIEDLDSVGAVAQQPHDLEGAITR